MNEIANFEMSQKKNSKNKKKNSRKKSYIASYGS